MTDNPLSFRHLFWLRLDARVPKRPGGIGVLRAQQGTAE